MTEHCDRRMFLKTVGAGATAAALPAIQGCGDGQEKIRTPNIDQLAAEGMRFTQHYSGSPVCAPSRCVLLTGKHTGHSYIRDNDEMNERGDVWHDPELEGQRLPRQRFAQRGGYPVIAIEGQRAVAINRGRVRERFRD